MLPDNEEALVEEAKRGSQEAFSRLVRGHQGAVYSLCFRMTGNPQEAEELTQESFLRFYRTLGRFRSDGRLRPWLHKITTNVCLDALRRRRDRAVPLDDITNLEDQPRVQHRGELPEDAYLGHEARLDVQRALLGLPGDYRIVLVLRYLEELSYQEIADAVGAPVSTVETRLFRAKKMLGRALATPLGQGKEETPHELQMEGRAGS